MTSIHARGAIAPLLVGLVLIGSLAACGGSGDGSPAATPLSISTSSLPTGEVGASYSGALTAAGGTAPYHWALASGTLPAGLTLAASGTITGTPTAAANATSIGIQVTDSASTAQTATRTLSVSIAPALAVTTTTLSAAQVGKPYTATLAATGGTAPLTWSLTAGSLPAGLSLTPSTGVIAGTPTTAVTAAPLTFAVADSNVPAQHKSVNLTLTVAPPVSIAISPRAAALTLGQTATLSVTTNDPAGVTWSVTPAGGSFAPMQSMNGTSTTFTAPNTAGSYTIQATSITNPAQSSTIKLGVTGLAGVFTYRNDVSRDGVNAQEYALTAGSGGTGGSVGTGTFGKLFSCVADGAIYAQPLWAANLTINGAVHNVVFVASAHDSLFAFDADANPCVQLWSVSLIDTAHGANAGEVTVPTGVGNPYVGAGYGDLTPETGVIGTPVIDFATGTLYVVSKSMNSSGSTFYQRLHAIDVTTGNEKANSPLLVQGTYPGTGDSTIAGGSTTTTMFRAQYELQRTGLALINGTVYIAWSAHEDAPPYYGWLMGYTYGASGFTQVSVLNVTPNVQGGGIWMGGGAPSADANGHVYVITGNGGFDANSGAAPNNDYGDTLLQLAVTPNPTTPSAAFSVSQYFTPSDQATDDSGDHDFGAGGAAMLANVTSGSGTVGVVVGGGKDGTLYVLNQAALGGYSGTDAGAFQVIPAGYPIFSTVSMWNNTIYLGLGSFVAASPAPLISYALQTSTTPSQFVQQAQTAATFGFPGPSPAISATGNTNGVVWALDNSQYCTHQSKGCGPAVLHAYDATSLVELWNSSMAAGGADAAGNAVKFTVPSIANGKVYIGTRGNNTGGALGSTSVSGELDVYGLQPN
jgi:hypothetical protein